MKTIYTVRDLEGKGEVEIVSPSLRRIINLKPAGYDCYIVNISYGDGMSKISRKIPRFPKIIKHEDLIGFLEGETVGLPRDIIEEIKSVHPYFIAKRTEILKELRDKDDRIKYQEKQLKYNHSIKELKNRLFELERDVEKSESDFKAMKKRKCDLGKEIRNLKRDLVGLKKYRDDRDWEKNYRQLSCKYKQLILTLIEPSKKSKDEKILGGSVNHHLPKGSDEFMRYLARIPVIDSIWTSRLEGKLLSGFKCDGKKIQFYYNDGVKTLIIDGITVARDKFEYDAVEEIIKQELEGFF
ncbi:MAG: hypothetical protein GTN38_02295 [Candidatus Aenigmarchaeota archaeon]|nr:hypothetical protein [Candidatus Aenigmarchaeota archaeon]NIP40383.1 hypothetical protein [Candidatus Aenigmarchaeota archaeon]NIQ18309.1 hypothetical protein [Candidatus Aenigmarchaeota archaeon]NIS73261.1 hypothetical protein [Candidatus Aenigmarchaeota archaeon]